MSIALTADILTKIAKSRRRFQDKCTNLKDATLALGKVFNGKIEDESMYKKLIMDRDFTGRTIINIICYQRFAPLMSEEDPKAEDLIMDMWMGEETTRCDGNISGYCNLIYILFQKSKKADTSTTYMDIVTNYFKLNTSVDYAFQHRYRSKDISFIFKKDILMALLLLLFSTYINLLYGIYFHKTPVYFHAYIDPTGTVLTEVAIDDA